MPEAASWRGGVFISYRRAESAFAVGWLHDRLEARFGVGSVFKDVDSIKPGDTFAEVIHAALRSCEVVLAVIGPGWLTVADEAGRRRLDDPDDFVALEIGAALSRSIRVVPVLIDGAAVPAAADLPPALAGLAARQGLELRPDRFAADTDRLLNLLQDWLAGSGSTGQRGPAVDTLVAPPGAVTGRTGEMVQLRDALAAASERGTPSVVVTLHGMGGVGKTVVARTFAAEVAARFGDGRFEVDLCGYTPGATPREPFEVLADLLALAGVAPSAVPTTPAGRSELWRSWLADRRVLLLLDNARESAQVRPLLPGGRIPGQSLVLVTSRRRLADLDGSTAAIGIDLLPPQDAVSVLVNAGRRTLHELAGREADLLALARACGRLPLALRTAGTLLARLDPAELVEIMKAGGHAFEYLPEVDRAAATAFSVSYQDLSSALRATLRGCAWHPGPDFDARSVAALTGLPRPSVAVQLVELHDANLLAGLADRRYTFHDLHRDYTRRQVAIEDTGPSIRAGHERLYADLRLRLDASARVAYPDNSRVIGSRTSVTGGPTLDEARLWLRTAADELTSAARAAMAEGWAGASGLVETLAYWMHAEGRAEQAHTLYRTLVAAARTADDAAGTATALEGLALVTYAAGRSGAARAAYQEALELHTQLGDRQGQANALKGLGDIARTSAEHAAADDHYRRASDLYAQLGSHRALAEVQMSRADVALNRGDAALAREGFQRACEQARAIGYRSVEADALCGLGDIAANAGDHAAAGEAFREAHDIYRQIGNRHGLAYALKGLADAARLRGDLDGARETYAQALSVYEQIGFHRIQARIHQRLGHIALTKGDPTEAEVHFQTSQTLIRSLDQADSQGPTGHG